MTTKKYCYQYPHPAVTTDCVIFAFDGVRLNVLLVERGIEPYKGKWAFPGGFINMDETAEQGAIRELAEETGLKDVYIEQLQAFSGINRDPRERVITIAFYALAPMKEVHGRDDARDAKWFPVDEVPPLAFDHDYILRIAIKTLREKIHFEPIGFELLPDTFTMTQLQNLYEAILGVKFDRRNFYKKFLKLGLVETVGECSGHGPFPYHFIPEKYKELHEKGFMLEF